MTQNTQKVNPAFQKRTTPAQATQPAQAAQPMQAIKVAEPPVPFAMIEYQGVTYIQVTLPCNPRPSSTGKNAILANTPGGFTPTGLYHDGQAVRVNCTAIRPFTQAEAQAMMQG